MARDYFHSLPLPSISLFHELGIDEQDLGYHQADEVSEISDDVEVQPTSIASNVRSNNPDRVSLNRVSGLFHTIFKDNTQEHGVQSNFANPLTSYPQHYPVSSTNPESRKSSQEQVLQRELLSQDTRYNSQEYTPRSKFPGQYTPNFHGYPVASQGVYYSSQDQMLPLKPTGEFTPNSGGFPPNFGPNKDWQGIPSRGSRLRPKTTQHGNTWMMIIAACIITTFSIYYSYRVLVSKSAVPRHLALSPGKTVLVVNVLSHVVALLCLHLFTDTSEALRWAWACNPRSGILFTSFLALSRATPLAGIWHLMFRKGSHQLWCFLR